MSVKMPLRPLTPYPVTQHPDPSRNLLILRRCHLQPLSLPYRAFRHLAAPENRNIDSTSPCTALLLTLNKNVAPIWALKSTNIPRKRRDW